MGEIEQGTCDVCGAEEVSLTRLYIVFRPDIDRDPVIIRHCAHCIPQTFVDDSGSISIEWEHREIV